MWDDNFFLFLYNVFVLTPHCYKRYTGFVFCIVPVVQRIGRKPPELEIGVRFLSGTQIRYTIVMLSIQFLGAAQEVTGAMHHVRTSKNQFLVDCGLFQVGAFADKRNYELFPIDVSKIDFLVITHAHIDHSGRVPKLIKEGFRGKIFCTKGTADLMRLMLEDGQGLLAEEAKHLKLPPLYEVVDVEKAMSLVETHEYGEEFSPVEGITVRLQDAGHILGSSIAEVWVKTGHTKRKIVFTGDLGNWPTPLLQNTAVIEEADYLVIESAYGDRLHEAIERRKDILEDVLQETIKNKGVVMIPTFAVERMQILLSEINELVEHGRIPVVPTFVDSPLAIKATHVYEYNRQYFNQKTTALIMSGDNIFKFPGLKLTLTTQESKAINDVPPPKIILAGSGSSTGGRILHHERRYLSDPHSVLIVVGYQSAGSLGRKLIEGETVVKIFGEDVVVRARIVNIEGYSGHADREKLLEFVRPMRNSLKQVFVVQGESHSAQSFAKLVEDTFAVRAVAPARGTEFALDH